MIAMMTIIIIGALILTIGISSAFQGQTEIVLVGQSDRRAIVSSLFDSCIEEALYRLKLDASYTGGTVPIGTDTCTVTVSGSGSSRTISATASSDVHSKTVSVGVSLKQNAAGNAKAWHVDSWSEQNPP